MLEETAAGAGGTTARRRVRARVEGTVQGVGFRPFVYRLASELDLAGFVLNDTRGVLLEVEGADSAVERFLERLVAEPPPLARIERVRPEELAAEGAPGFEIVHSDATGEASAPVSPDSATCADCLAELRDPADRRHRYPFINCTNCGPRFTIVRGVPYDRPLTTMAGFELCERCRAEYEDPLDRRFHAQPNACPDCGPTARLIDSGGTVLEAAGGDAVRGAAEALVSGRIVAVKGLGGYHLACRADDETAVAALRARKHREDKPFALMAPDLEFARGLVDLTDGEVAVLTGPERPIVVARGREDARVADAVAPRSHDLGVMLPYTPLHHLLLADAGTTLVMTSANLSDEPIAYRDDDARSRLGAIADLFLLHDRPIHMRTDDSVVRAASAGRGEPMLLRRSRGYVPAHIGLPVAASRPSLACGAELKSTFCLAKGERAWVGHHIGDLQNFETLQSFAEGIAHFEALFAVAPEVVAHDLHPDYLSTRYALEREGVDHVGVQHHHAHLAACLAEHGETGPAVGAIYDGTGYGLDGTVWGGELLVGGLDGFERAGSLRPVRLPGGDRAVREPWRMACAWLADALGEELPARPAALAEAVDELRWRQIASLAHSGLAAPVTTSAGRLFDAVAALCGIRAVVNYEGQAAIELEAAADPLERGAYPIALVEATDRLILDPREAVAGVAREVAAGEPVAAIAARFHHGMADATARACAELAESRGLDTVVLSGGVFQNRLLLERTTTRLEEASLRVLRPVRLPANDGGIAYGQAAVATVSG
ncbi:MAG: carbamoyltransferase HypF [Actinomycetota bacterium]|nr:carbamoyltransferase HypF [Actinomycetota bacterium]